MSKINFTAQGARSRTLRVAPDKFKQSKGRPNISMGPGERPSTPFIPYKHLPVEFLDISTQDYVVIPKGRAVSAITANNDASILGDGTDYNGAPRGIMGLVVPANGGVARTVTSPVDATSKVLPANYPIGIAEHDMYQDINGDALNYDMRNRYTGVLARSLVKLPSVDVKELDAFIGLAKHEVETYAVTIDNSGAAMEVAIATIAAAADGGKGIDEDEHGFVFTAATSVARVGEETETYTASFDGSALTVTSDGAYTENAVVTVTYYYYAHNMFCDSSVGGPVDDSLASADTSAYFAVSPKFGFLTIKDSDAGVAGLPLKPDFYGNWIPGTGVQSIARLMLIDYRFNKDLMDTIQTVYEENPAYRVAGTGTMGIPQFLYDFAYAALTQAYIKAGTTFAAVLGTSGYYEGKDAAQVVLAAVEAGVFGYAWIQVNV